MISIADVTLSKFLSHINRQNVLKQNIQILTRQLSLCLIFVNYFKIYIEIFTIKDAINTCKSYVFANLSRSLVSIGSLLSAIYLLCDIQLIAYLVRNLMSWISAVVSVTSDPNDSQRVKEQNIRSVITALALFVKNQCDLRVHENYIIRCSVSLEINSPVCVDVHRRRRPDWSTGETRPVASGSPWLTPSYLCPTSFHVDCIALYLVQSRVATRD